MSPLDVPSPSAPLPVDEIERLKDLDQYGLLDTAPEAEYDQLTELAAEICQTPMAALSVVEIGRQCFKSSVGLPVRQTRRDVSFCAWAILEPASTLVVPDATRDPRFAANPLVTGELGLRSYAGVPLVTAAGRPVGALCVLDRRPRDLAPRQLSALRTLADQVVGQLELRRVLMVNEVLERRLRHWEGMVAAVGA